MAKASTVKLARELLTPTQFKAWKAMPVKLSASELRAGKKPGGARKKAAKKAPAKKKGKRVSAAQKQKLSLLRQIDRDWEELERSGGRTPAFERSLRSNPSRRPRNRLRLSKKRR